MIEGTALSGCRIPFEHNVNIFFISYPHDPMLTTLVLELDDYFCAFCLQASTFTILIVTAINPALIIWYGVQESYYVVQQYFYSSSTFIFFKLFL